MTSGPVIGASILRKEDRRFLTGRGTYVADIERPGMTFGVFVRSPHAHARIRAIDSAAALALPGVLAVLTGEDIKRDLSESCSDFSATFTTIAFDNSSLRWLEIGS
jgi:CO/xanthine dehydrogenase Mo-binding subunit